MSHLLISYNLLAQMVALSFNKKYDLIYHARYLESSSGEQTNLTRINQREIRRENILRKLGSIESFKIRFREMEQLKAIVCREGVTEITLVTYTRQKNDLENFQKLTQKFKMQKINWILISEETIDIHPKT